MNYFYLSAAHKSSGKTTVGIGLCAALRHKSGFKVQPFKKGPDYIDPMWLGAAAGRPCYNLDFFVQSENEIQREFHERMQGADIGLLEGNKGLFDGVALDGSNSNAALAAVLNAPVVLVVDCRGITRGIAPLLLGYQRFTPKVDICGVILNRVGAERHEIKLRQAVEHYTDIPVLGAVPDCDELRIVERHLGLMPSNEHEQASKVIDSIASVVAASVDLERVSQLVGSAPILPKPAAEVIDRPSSPASVQIGILRDSAFGFYYPGDLEALEEAGAELVFFSALQDQRLPETDGLFIGGGFPETHAARLESNQALRSEIKNFIDNDGPVYAECGGLMYLSRRLIWRDNACKMVGAIPADAVMYERPQGRGYVRLQPTSSHPWTDHSSLSVSSEIPAHEFHYSRLENYQGKFTFAYEVKRGRGIDGHHDGIVYKNLLANYAHMRHVEGNPWATRFVAHVARCSQKTNAEMRQHIERSTDV